MINKFAKFCISLFVLLTSQTLRGNTIDSISDRRTLLEFLETNLNTSGIIYLRQSSSLVQIELKMPVQTYLDTILVQDPSNNEWIKKVIVRQFEPYCPPDTENFFSNYPLSVILEIIKKYPIKYYKVDIDGNKQTDLIIDAGIVIVVLDKKGKFEGHLFSDQTEINSFSYKNCVLLEDSSIGLILRHDYNTCSDTNLYYSKESKTVGVKYITNQNSVTVHGNKSWSDTLYKITKRTYDSKEYNSKSKKYVIVKRSYSDTTDMILYNKVDTLVYKYGGFLKYNNDYQNKPLSKINYIYHQLTSDQCHDGVTCLEINENGDCLLRYVFRGMSIDLSFVSALDSNKLAELWHFISYQKSDEIKSSYLCPFVIHNSRESTNIFHYKDGTIKIVKTRGYCPVLPLGYLNKYISDIVKSLDWKQLKENERVSCYCPTQYVSEEYNLKDCDCRF